MTYTKTNLNETTETVAVDMTAEDIENNETTETIVEQNARGYSKTVWNESTPITADKLNKMETGIANGIDKSERIMEIPITNSDGWQQFKWTKPGATTVSWTRDANGGKALEVLNETTHQQLLLLKDDGGLEVKKYFTVNGDDGTGDADLFLKYNGKFRGLLRGLSGGGLQLHSYNEDGTWANYLELSGGSLTTGGKLAFSSYGSGGLSSIIHNTALHAHTGNGQMMNVGNGNIIYVGNPNTRLTIESNTTPEVNVGGSSYQLFHTGNFNPDTKLNAGHFSVENRDLKVYGKRALVGFNTPDGNYLSINHDTDFANGVAIHGLTVVDKIENSGNLVFSKIGGGGINACIANSTLNAATGNGQMLNVGNANTIHVGNPNTPLYIESSSNPIVHVGGGAHALLHSGSLTQKMRFGGYSADRWDNSQIEINAGPSGGIARLNFHREGNSQMSIVHKTKDQLHVEYDNGAQKRILTDGDPCARFSWDGSRISIDGGRNNAAVSLADTSEVARHIHNSHTGRNFKFRADAGLGPLEGEITFTW